MLRAALGTLLAACLLTGCLQAQHASAHGSAGRPSARSGVGSQRGGTNRSTQRYTLVPNRTPRRTGAGSYFLPYGESFDNDNGQPDAEAANAPLPVVIPRPAEPPLPRAQVIEIPGVAGSPAKELPPTVFVLASGERLEARRFVLTASNLSVSIGHQQRTVPLAQLDLDATLAANHGRGIDLRIPDDGNQISLSF
jgi:hypothetical protein